MRCQWGTIRRWRVIAEGLYAVEAERNGGLMLGEDFAIANLSIPARMRAVICSLGGYQTWYCYSRDSYWAIVALELPEPLSNEIFLHCCPASDLNTYDQRLQFLVQILSRTNADYLVSMHIKPDMDALREWLADKTEHDVDADDDAACDLSSKFAPYC